MNRFLRSLCWLPLLSLALLPACATTKLTSVWKDPSYQERPRKIMVIGLLHSPANKRLFEDEMVRQLRTKGIDALAGYSVIPENPAPDKEVVEKVMKEQGADAVLIARIVDRKTVQNVIPSTPMPAGPVYGPAPGYYGARWGGYYAYSPPMVVQDEYAVAQTNLYDLKTEKLIWTAASETWLADSDAKTVLTFVDVVMKRLARDGIAAAGRGR